MGFSELKRQKLRPQKERKLSTFLLALLLASALFVPYIILGKGYFIFYGDFNVQQIPFYKMCHAAIRNGNLSWSFTTDLGANFIGSYSFYLLGSPFFWTTLLFPNSFVPYLMGPLLILKFAFAAFTAYLYIRRFTKTPAAAQLGALLYAFSGFSVYNIFFNHFHEAIIVFPLLLLSLELLITENRRGVFALCVALSAVTNYFFFFGMAVFTVIYYIVRVLRGAVKFKIGKFLSVVLEAVLGVGIAGFLLVPSIFAIIGNTRVTNFLLGWNGIMYGKEQIYLNIVECFFFPPDLPARPVFFPEANVKWSSLGGWLPFIGMAGVFSWYNMKRKNWVRTLITVCAVMAFVPVLNSAFYAFNTAYYARWFYMPILIMCLATARVFEDPTVDIKKGFVWSSIITAVFALTIGLFPEKNSDGKIVLGLFTKDSDNTSLIRFIVSVSIVAFCVLALGIAVYTFNKNRKKLLTVSIAGVCIISILYGNVFIAMGRSHSYDIESVMIDKMIEGNVSLDGAPDTFRIDTYDGVDNTAMFLGYSSMNAFHSVVPSSIMEFYDYIGYKRDVGSRAGTDYYALRPLLSVKYLLNRKDGESFVGEDGETKMPGFTYEKTSGGYYVYKNENFVPYGFSYSYAMDKNFCDEYANTSRPSLMLKAMLLSKADMQKYSSYITDISTLSPFDDTIEDVVLFDENGMSKVSSEDETSASSGVEESDSAGSESSKESEAGNGDETSSQNSETSSLISKKEDNVRTEKSPVNLDLSKEEMSLDAKRLAATSAKKFSTHNGGFTATVNRETKSLVFFSIPYDSGWSATVNGKKVDIIKANVGFMAVPVDAGESTISFEYKTPGLFLGFAVTTVSVIAFLVYFIIALLIRKKSANCEVYPEGEYLLEHWHSIDIAEAAENVFSGNDFGDLEAFENQPETTEPGILDGLDFGLQSGEDDPEISGGFSVDSSLFDDD